MLATSIQTAILAVYLLSKVGGETNEDDLEVTVEILVILDKELSDEIDHAFSRKRKYCEIFDEVQSIYDTLKEDGVKITINLSGLKLTTELKDQLFIEKPLETKRGETFITINTTEVMLELYDLIEENSWNNEYDVVIFLTNKTMRSKVKTRILGYTLVSGSCNNERNLAISRPMAERIAHEIGHQLGASNDVINMPEDIYSYVKPIRYIMSESSPVDHLKFSRSSVEQFIKFLRSPESDCLRTTNVNDTVVCWKKTPCPNFCTRFQSSTH
uniref:Putative metalloproteinase n=1 Tax=Megacormus gertschi TaxID=1843536 RepID=A0A224XFG7_9SCOR